MKHNHQSAFAAALRGDFFNFWLKRRTRAKTWFSDGAILNAVCSLNDDDVLDGLSQLDSNHSDLNRLEANERAKKKPIKVNFAFHHENCWWCELQNLAAAAAVMNQMDVKERVGQKSFHFECNFRLAKHAQKTAAHTSGIGTVHSLCGWQAAAEQKRFVLLNKWNVQKHQTIILKRGVEKRYWWQWTFALDEIAEFKKRKHVWQQF